MMECDVVRDLLPLYVDDACSEKSRSMVEEHLQECAACSGILEQLRETEIESNLKSEKETVLQYGARRFKRRSEAVGAVVAGLFMIPILVCLIVNITSGAALGWFFVVLASLCVAASLILVPLMVPEDKAFWTFCSFCCSLIILLLVVCLYTGGKWFFIASSAVIFGLGLIFLPFVVKARPVRRLIGDTSPLLLVLSLDAVLFVNMMLMISLRSGITRGKILYLAGLVAGIAFIVIDILRNRGIIK